MKTSAIRLGAIIAAVGLAGAAATAWGLEIDCKMRDGLEFHVHDGKVRSAAGLGWELFLGDAGPELRCGDFGLGTIGGRGLTFKTAANDWVTATANYATPATPEASPAGASSTLGVSVSRLTPAALVRGKYRIQLFTGERFMSGKKKGDRGTAASPSALPRFFALADGRVRPIAELAQPLAQDLNRGWILFWWGAESPWRESGYKWQAGEARLADIPVLVVFSEQLASVQATGPVQKLPTAGNGDAAAATEFGVRFDFGMHEARLAVLPLYGGPVYLNGDDSPKPNPNSPRTTWKDKLPETVLAQCKFWADHLAEIPSGLVKETVDRDDKSDAVTIRSTFTFERIRGGGQRLAPLPAVLAAAKLSGMAISVPGNFVVTELTTRFGPYAGVAGGDTSSYTVSGLGKYVFGERVVGAKQVPKQLQETIDREADRIIEAGILAPPFYFLRHGPLDPDAYHQFRERLVFSNPGFNLFVLAQLADAVDPQRREKLLALMKEWRTKYPPETVAHQPHDDARRERSELYVPRAIFQRWPARDANFHISNHVVPVENLYYLAEYCRATGERPLTLLTTISGFYQAHIDWASGGFFRWGDKLHLAFGAYDHSYGRNYVSELNQFMAAMIGQIRLARLTADSQAESEAWHALARASMLRLAVAKAEFQLRLDPTADFLLKFRSTVTADAFYGVCDERGPSGDMFSLRHSNALLLPYTDLVPEVARFLQDHARPEVKRFCDMVTTNVPDWYRTFCDVIWIGEQAYMYPSDADQLFACHAWVVEDADPMTLYKWCDIPWVPTGDMYYIRKLVETKRAYQGWAWK